MAHETTQGNRTFSILLQHLTADKALQPSKLQINTCLRPRVFFAVPSSTYRGFSSILANKLLLLYCTVDIKTANMHVDLQIRIDRRWSLWDIFSQTSHNRDKGRQAEQRVPTATCSDVGPSSTTLAQHQNNIGIRVSSQHIFFTFFL